MENIFDFEPIIITSDDEGISTKKLPDLGQARELADVAKIKEAMPGQGGDPGSAENEPAPGSPRQEAEPLVPAVEQEILEQASDLADVPGNEEVVPRQGSDLGASENEPSPALPSVASEPEPIFLITEDIDKNDSLAKELVAPVEPDESAPSSADSDGPVAFKEEAAPKSDEKQRSNEESMEMEACMAEESSDASSLTDRPSKEEAFDAEEGVGAVLKRVHACDSEGDEPDPKKSKEV
ncbi:hypothetical protein KR018_006021 [Drosophila ironensis]|nr:hypothetical protein KR018_006021 [Drosophila ironensis]